VASVPGKTKDLEEPQGLNCEPCATLAATFMLAITKSLAFVYAFFMRALSLKRSHHRRAWNKATALAPRQTKGM